MGIVRQKLFSDNKKLWKKELTFVFCVLSSFVLFATFFRWYGSLVNKHNFSQEDIQNGTLSLSDKETSDWYVRNWNGDTDEWQTYYNEHFLFSFKYPQAVFDISFYRTSNYEAGVSLEKPVDNLQIWLTQKGYDMDNPERNFIVDFNSLKTYQEYYIEDHGECKPISLGGWHGKICEDTYLAEDNIRNYESLIENGVCLGRFGVVIGEIKRLDGDVVSGVSVGCNNDFNMPQIYQEMLRSIRLIK